MSTNVALIILVWALGAGLVWILFYIWCRDEPDDDEWADPGAEVVWGETVERRAPGKRD